MFECLLTLPASSPWSCFLCQHSSIGSQRCLPRPAQLAIQLPTQHQHRPACMRSCDIHESDEYWVSRPLHQHTNTPTLPDPPSHTTISMECGIRQLCVDGSKHALATATILSPFFDTSTCMYRSPAIIFQPRQLPCTPKSVQQEYYPRLRHPPILTGASINCMLRGQQACSRTTAMSPPFKKCHMQSVIQ